MKKLRKNLSIKITSLFLSLVLIFQLLIYNNGGKLDFLKKVNKIFIFLGWILLAVVLYFIIKLLVDKISSITFKEKEYSKKDLKKLFIISFISMFLIWLICYITVFPGGGDYDTFYQLSAPGAASSQHPILYSYLLNFFIVKLGYNILNSSILGWAIFSMLQMCFVIFTLSYTLCFLAKRNTPKWLIVILIIIYTFIPIYAVYSLYTVKDVLFATLLIYEFLLLIRLVETKGEILNNRKFSIVYITLGCILFITRSNALVTCILVTGAMLICYRKYMSKVLIICLLIPFLFNFTINKVMEQRYNVVHYFQESMAIPLQQISATVYSNGKLNKGEKDLVSHLLSLKEIKKSYSTGTVDAIKWHEDFDREYLQINKLRFLKNWATIMVKNFDIYVESYALQTQGYWSIEGITTGRNMYNDVQSDKQDGYVGKQKKEYKISCKDLLPDGIQTKLEEFYYTNTQFLTGGTCFWITVLAILVIIAKQKRKYIITYLPVLSVWLSMMVASPLAHSLRYMFPFVLMLPILIAYSLILKKED